MYKQTRSAIADCRQIWVSEPHFWEVTGDTWCWLMARCKAHGRLTTCLNWIFFATRRNVYSSAVFTGGRLLCRQILSGQGRLPSIILGIRKLQTPGYLTVTTVSFWVPSFWHNTGVWRMDGYAYTAFAKLALRHAVKSRQSDHDSSKYYIITQCVLMAAELNSIKSFIFVWQW